MGSGVQGHMEGSDCGLSGGQGGDSRFHCLSLSFFLFSVCMYLCVCICVFTCMRMQRSDLGCLF